MTWNKGYPEFSGQYLVRFTWCDDEQQYKDVGVARYDGRWHSVSDSDGVWSEGVDVTGWIRMPDYGED